MPHRTEGSLEERRKRLRELTQRSLEGVRAETERARMTPPPPQPEGFLRRAARVLLPKPLERAVGLEEPRKAEFLPERPPVLAPPTPRGPVIVQPVKIAGTDVAYDDVANFSRNQIATINQRLAISESELRAMPRGAAFSELSGGQQVIKGVTEFLAAREAKKRGEPIPVSYDDKLREVENLRKAKTAYEQIMVQAISGNGTALQELSEGARNALIDEPTKRIPFYGAAETAKDFADVLLAYDKRESGVALNAVEEAKMARVEAQLLRDAAYGATKSKWYAVGRMVPEMSTYAIEFAMTAGTYNVAKHATTQAALKAGAPKVVTKSAGVLIGTAAQTTAFAPQISESAAKYMLPERDLVYGPQGELLVSALEKRGDSFEVALAKAFGRQYIEILTERAGTIVERPTNFLMRATLGKWLARTGLSGFPVSTALNRIRGHIAWNGIIGEVFEEEIANIGQKAIAGERLRVSDIPFNIVSPEGQERVFVETLGITAFAGIAQVPNIAIGQINSARTIEAPPQITEEVLATVEERKLDIESEEQSIAALVGTQFRGEAFRVDTGFVQAEGATALDVVRFEAKELGNREILAQAESLGIDLAGIPASDIVWVTSNPGDAMRYTPTGTEVDEVQPITLPPHAFIVALDGEGGFLVYRGDRPLTPRVKEPAKPKEEVKEKVRAKPRVAVIQSREGEQRRRVRILKETAKEYIATILEGPQKGITVAFPKISFEIAQGISPKGARKVQQKGMDVVAQVRKILGDLSKKNVAELKKLRAMIFDRLNKTTDATEGIVLSEALAQVDEEMSRRRAERLAERRAPGEPEEVPGGMPELVSDELVEITDELQERAERDWEDNFAEEYGEREAKLAISRKELETARAVDRGGIQVRIEHLETQQVGVVERFVNKWRNIAIREAREEAPVEEERPEEVPPSSLVRHAQTGGYDSAEAFEAEFKIVDAEIAKMPVREEDRKLIVSDWSKRPGPVWKRRARLASAIFEDRDAYAEAVDDPAAFWQAQRGVAVAAREGEALPEEGGPRNETERRVMELRKLRTPFSDIAREVGITQARTRQIVEKYGEPEYTVPKPEAVRERIQQVRTKAVTKEKAEAKIFDHVGKFADTSARALPVLGQIAIRDGSTLEATDLETAIEYRLSRPVFGGKSGTIAAKTLKGKGVDDIEKVFGQAKIGSVDDFPVLPKVDKPTVEVSFTLDADVLARVLETVSRETTRPELQGVLFRFADGNLSIASTDTFRLTQVVIPEVKGKGDFILGGGSAKKLVNLLRSTKPETVEFRADNDMSEFSFLGFRVIARNVDGTFPDYKQILPTTPFPKGVAVNTELLKTALKDAKPFLDRLGVIGVTFGKNEIIIQAKNEESGKFEQRVPAEVLENIEAPDASGNLGLLMPIRAEGAVKVGETLGEILVNDRLLEGMVRLLPGERTAILFREATKPITVLSTDEFDVRGKPPVRRRAPAGEALPAPEYGIAGRGSINKMVDRMRKDREADRPQEPGPNFKVSDQVKAILEEFGVVTREREISKRKYLGLFKPLGKIIRLQALYDVTTAAHEATHAIDTKNGIFEDIKLKTGNGDAVRKSLTDVYERLYSNAGKPRQHPLRKRMREGLATFIENYFYNPAETKANYPLLVAEFIEPEGTFYYPDITRLLERMNGLVEEYARLTPEQRIGARIRTGKEVVEEKSGFSLAQRAIFELFNRFEPLKRYGKIGGVAETWDDPWVQSFLIMGKNSLTWNWVKGKVTPIIKRDGNFEIREGTVQDYMKMVVGKEQEFRAFLIARRVVGMHNKLAELENATSEIEGLLEEGFVSEDEAEDKRQIEERNRLRQIIANDDFSLQDATAVVEKFSGEFAEPAKRFDEINNRLIEFAYGTNLIDAETALRWRSEEGYASFRRYIEDDLDANPVGTVSTNVRSKVSSFKERTGSRLDIIDPMYSQVLAVNEIISKGLENMLWLKVDNIALDNDEVQRRFEKLEVKAAVSPDGRISFPQERDPNVIRFFRNGKRQFRKAGPEFLAVAKTLRPSEMGSFGRLIRIPSSIFTRLTTSANPFFALGNLSVDQFSALTQTKKGFVPVKDPATSLVDFIRSDPRFVEYLAIGGRRQTLAAYFDLSPEELSAKLTGFAKQEGVRQKIEQRLGRPVGNIVDAALGLLEMPSNTSELITRYSEYKRALDSGEPDAVALFRASEITTPFQLTGHFFGTVGQAWRSSIPYFNAALQVLYKFGRTAGENPDRVATVAAGMAASVLALAIATMRYASDEQKRAIAQQQARLLSRYVFVPLPDGKTVMRFRIPEQFGAITGMVYLFVFSHYGKSKAAFDEYFDAATAWMPEQVDIGEYKKIPFAVLPQAISPFVQAAFGQRTFPEVMPIVPQSLQDEPPEYQYTAYTSKVARVLGDILGISPIKVEFMVREAFGGVGSLTLGKPSPSMFVDEERYILSGRAINNFYDDKDQVELQYKRVDRDPKAYSKADRREIEDRRDLYNDVAKILSDSRKIVREEKELPDRFKEELYRMILVVDDPAKEKEVRSAMRSLRKQLDKLD